MAELSHFKFYGVESPAAEKVKTLKLQGQFDTDRKAKVHTVARLTHFGIPVSKNGEGIPDPVTHLDWYEMAITDEPLRKVTISNQFFESTILEVGDPLVLLVPALKLKLDEPIEAGVKPPTSVSHFKCYRVGKGKAPATRAGVELEDQFDVENRRKMTTQVGPPVYFCVPVSKVHVQSGGVETAPTEIIEGTQDHLVIYKITALAYKQQRRVFDQFDGSTEQLRRLGGFVSRYLAVPTKKLDWS